MSTPASGPLELLADDRARYICSRTPTDPALLTLADCSAHLALQVRFHGNQDLAGRSILASVGLPDVPQ